MKKLEESAMAGMLPRISSVIQEVAGLHSAAAYMHSAQKGQLHKKLPQGAPH
jgi:hypothetical protein